MCPGFYHIWIDYGQNNTEDSWLQVLRTEKPRYPAVHTRRVLNKCSAKWTSTAFTEKGEFIFCVLLKIPFLLSMSVYFSQSFLNVFTIARTKYPWHQHPHRIQVQKATVVFGSPKINNLWSFCYIFQRCFPQDELMRWSPLLLKLGLLFDTGVDVGTVRELPTFVCFQHKLLQEYSGAYHVSQRLERAQDMKVTSYFYTQWRI